MEKLAYTIPEFCEATGVRRTTAYNLIRLKQIERVKIGGRTLITATSVRALIERASGQEGGL